MFTFANVSMCAKIDGKVSMQIRLKKSFSVYFIVTVKRKSTIVNIRDRNANSPENTLIPFFAG